LSVKKKAADETFIRDNSQSGMKALRKIEDLMNNADLQQGAVAATVQEKGRFNL
jgi:hypothetical protein